MKIGIPKGLLYYRYYPFVETFFKEIGLEVITSENTNKNILDKGVECAVDEACLPIKVFHGHVLSIKDKCDVLFIPRIMRLYKEEFICPKFCGLPEMILNSIENLPPIICTPIEADGLKGIKKWALSVGIKFNKNIYRVNRAIEKAIENQIGFKSGVRNIKYDKNIALVGHPYNLYDNYLNMDIIKKLNERGIGVITEEHIDSSLINNEASKLFKKPFWTFGRNSYGFATYVKENKLVDGIIYISSFACGIDSVVVDLIKERTKDFPFLLIKIDEHTGEAGFKTRLEAFVDMLERRCIRFDNNFSTPW